LPSSIIQQILTSVPILLQGLRSTGREEEAKMVQKRATDLEQVARIPNATLQHLLDLAGDRTFSQDSDPDTLDFSRSFNPADWEPWVLTRGRRKGTQVFRHLVNRKMYRDTLPDGYTLAGNQIVPATLVPSSSPGFQFPTSETLNAGVIRPLTRGEDVQTGTSPLFEVKVGDQKYFVKHILSHKVGLDNTLAAANEDLISRAAQEAGVPVLPVALIPFQGKEALVAPWQEGKALVDFPDTLEVLKRLPVEDVARQGAFAYLTGIWDRHLGNYFLTEDGRLLSIDHEFLQKPFLMDQTLLDNNELLDRRLQEYPLSPEMAQQLLACVPTMLQEFQASGRDDEARRLQKRARDLEQAARIPHATLGHLRDFASVRGVWA
jgi:hypothetical protein